MVKSGQKVPAVCPICGKKIMGIATQDGIVRLSCNNCKIVATSKYKSALRMDIRISFASAVSK